MHQLILKVKIGKNKNYIRIKNNHMSNKFFLWVVSALLLLVGCTNDEIVNEQQTPEEGKITLTASVPGETAQTRLSLIPDIESKNIIVTWQEGDTLRFYFKQGENFSPTSTFVELTWEDISPDEKSATFTVDVPQGIDQGSAFTVYAVHGAESRLEGANVLVNVSPSAFTPLYYLQDVPIAGSVEVTPGDPINISFGHLGTLQCLAVKNIAQTRFRFIPSLIFADPETGTDWFYTATEGNIPYYSLTEGTVTYSNEPLPPLAPNLISIWIDEIGELAQWVMPKTEVYAPEIKLGALVPDRPPVVSANSKPQRTSNMQTGRAYHLYAAWDGGSLFFTDDTFIPPYQSVTGSLMHADGGDDFIGVVYSKDDSRVYYNSSLGGNDWPNETDLGAGTEARMTIDRSNHPHVVFTTDGKIAYRKLEGTTWSDPVYIESNFGGSCSKPDIDVDNSGYAHITYTDTRGQTGGYTERDDIMYAENKTNNGGAFVKSVIYNGYYEHWGGADYYGDYYDKGSRIAVDGAGNYYIIAHHQRFNKWTGGSDRTYNLVIKTSTASGGTTTSSIDGFDIYDLKGGGYSNVIALYKDSNVNRTAEIEVYENTASFSDYPYNFETSGIVPHGLSRWGYEVAGLSGSNLFVKYLYQADPREEVFSDITVKANTQVAAVIKGDVYYYVFLVYTDSTDSIIKVLGVETPPPC